VFLFFITHIILKIFKTFIAQPSNKLKVVKVIFVIPFLFLYFNLLFNLNFPAIEKVINKPKQWQKIKIINDTKQTQNYLFLQKNYLDNHWSELHNLEGINLNIVYQIKSQQEKDFLFRVDTNESNRIAIINLSTSKNTLKHSIIIQVPDLPIILFSNEFKENINNSFILKNNIEDYLHFSIYFVTFIASFYIILIVNSLFEGKIIYKIVLYLFLVTNLLFSGFLSYNFLLLTIL
jgi:hypothetical protein